MGAKEAVSKLGAKAILQAISSALFPGVKFSQSRFLGQLGAKATLWVLADIQGFLWALAGAQTAEGTLYKWRAMSRHPPTRVCLPTSRASEHNGWRVGSTSQCL